MSGSAVIDLATGLIFVFLLVSLICSKIGDFVSNLLRWRARELEKGMRDFIVQGDLALLKQFYEHPAITSLAPIDSWTTRLLQRVPILRGLVHQVRYSSPQMDLAALLPSVTHIPPRAFALALFNSIVPGANDETEVGKLRDKIKAWDTASPLKQTLLALVNPVDEKIENVRKNVENWFDDTMEKTTAIYQRNMWRFAFLTGIVVSVLLNVDTVSIANSLWHDASLRSTVVSAATEYAKTKNQSSNEQVVNDAVKKATQELDNLNLPLGWQPSQTLTFFVVNRTPTDWVKLQPAPMADMYLWKVIGWLITGFAGAQGAPFWFDLLRKLTQKSE